MKREREKKITRLHLILFGLVVIIAIIVVLSIKIGGSNRIKKYKKLEEDLRTATIYYYAPKASELEKSRMEVVSLKTIVDNGYLQDEMTSKCEGYTIISNYRNLDGEYEIGYEPFIKCGNSYISVNYDEQYLK